MRIIFLLIMSSYKIAVAQTYIPFPSTYGKWVYDFRDARLHFDNDEIIKSTLYELQNDTTISSFLYKKLNINTVYAGALREEDKIIYFYPDTATREYVLYNFNLEVDDIFTVFTEDYGSKTTQLKSIDFISASDGMHKQFHFKNDYDDWEYGYGEGISVWIEGIGSIYGLLSIYRPDCGQWICQDDLKCMTSDNTFQYPPNEEVCIVTSNKNQLKNEAVSIFPNPSISTFSIDFKNESISEICVTDILGTIVYRKYFTQESKHEIPVLPAGHYTLSLTDVNNRVIRKKITSVK